jgi:hypothetical protein
MLSAILTWLGGGMVKQLTDPLLAAYQAKLNAQNDSDRLAAEQQIAFFEGQIALAQTAAMHDRWWSTRELIGKCVLLYVAKLVVWDTVLAWGVTPDPGPVVGGIVMVVIGFYFGSKAASDIAGKLLAASMGRRP